MSQQTALWFFAIDFAQIRKEIQVSWWSIHIFSTFSLPPQENYGICEFFFWQKSFLSVCKIAQITHRQQKQKSEKKNTSINIPKPLRAVRRLAVSNNVNVISNIFRVKILFSA